MGSKPRARNVAHEVEDSYPEKNPVGRKVWRLARPFQSMNDQPICLNRQVPEIEVDRSQFDTPTGGIFHYLNNLAPNSALKIRCGGVPRKRPTQRHNQKQYGEDGPHHPTANLRSKRAFNLDDLFFDAPDTFLRAFHSALKFVSWVSHAHRPASPCGIILTLPWTRNEASQSRSKLPTCCCNMTS